MFKSIHGIAPHYISDRIDMRFDIHGYVTREAGQWPFIFLLSTKRYTEIVFFLYPGGKLWNDLPDFVKNSTNIETFKEITESINAWT